MQVSQVQWDFDAWEDYLYWQNHDNTVLIFSCRGHYDDLNLCWIGILQS